MSELSVTQHVEVAEQQLNKLSSIVEQKPEKATVLFRHPKKRDTYGGWRWLDLDDDLKPSIIKIIQQKVVLLSGKNVASLDFDSVTDDCLGVVPSNEFHKFSEGFDALPSARQAGAVFDNQSTSLDKTKVVAFVLDFEEIGQIRLFQNVGASFVIAKKMLGVIEGAPNRIKEVKEQVFQLPSDFSIMEYDGYVYIINENRFSSITNFDEQIKTASMEALNKIKTLTDVKINNLDELEGHLLGSREFMRRLASANKAGALDNRSIDKMLEDIETYEIEVSGSINSGVLELDADLSGRKGRRDFVDLLADKIATSNSSGVGYRMQKASPLPKRRK